MRGLLLFVDVQFTTKGASRPRRPGRGHAREGVATIAALFVVLLVVTAWRLDHLGKISTAPMSAMAARGLTPTVRFARRRYRHVLAGVLTVAVLLGLFAAVVQR
jgi:hypothetical protein